MEIFIFILWFFLSIIAGVIANNKGRSGFGFFSLSVILSPLIGIIAALLAKENINHVEKIKILSGEHKKCPYCAELIKKEAKVCRYCNRELVKTTGSVGKYDSYDDNGYTPLMNAVDTKNSKLVEELIQKGANPRIEDKNFGTSTALDMAKLALNRAEIKEDIKIYQEIIAILEPIT